MKRSFPSRWMLGQAINAGKVKVDVPDGFLMMPTLSSLMASVLLLHELSGLKGPRRSPD